MYSEIKKDENPLQVAVKTGRKKPTNKKTVTLEVKKEPLAEKKLPGRSTKPRLQFAATKSRRWYYQTRSKKDNR